MLVQLKIYNPAGLTIAKKIESERLTFTFCLSPVWHFMWLAAFLSGKLSQPISWQFRNPRLGSAFGEKSA